MASAPFAADAGLPAVESMPGVHPARTSIHSGRAPFAVAERGPVHRMAPAPKIPYSIGSNGADAIPARAAVIYSDAWTGDTSAMGFYEVPTSGTECELTLLTASDYAYANSGILAYNDKLMVVSSVTEYGQRMVSYYVLDSESYSMSDMGMLPSSFHAFSMVYDPTTGNSYASTRDMTDGSYHFSRFDTSAFTLTDIKDYETPLSFNGLGVTPGGEIYGITFPGDLYRVDKENGNATLVASLGIASEYASSGAINPRNGLFYYATCCKSGSALYEIDPSTGETAKVYDLPDNEELVGMYFPANASELAPDYPQNVSFNFEGTSLTGSVTFTMPTTLIDGSEATGSASYAICIDDQVAATGTAGYGEQVTDEITVEKAGMYKITVYLSNHDGDGPKTTDNLYIGADTPLKVENVRLSYADGAFTLEWDAAKGAHGGVLEEPVYTVVRMDGTTVADKTSATTFSEAYAEPEEGLDVVSYTVVASASGESAEAATSNRVTLGFVAPPYTNDMSTENDAAHFTVFNHNGDSNSWEWDKRGFYGCYYDVRHSAADDYLFLPPTRLEEGKVYTVSFDAYGFETSQYTEKVALYVGTACDPESLTTCLAEPTEVVKNERKRITANFKAPADGIFHFAIHCCSDPDQFVLYVDNAEISAPLSTEAPGMVTGLTVTPDQHGALSATISFTAPETDLDGNALKDLSRVDVFNGDRLVASLTPAAGATASCTDSNATAGENTYEVVTFNMYGEGEHALASAFVGFAAPERTEWFKAAAGSDYGRVKLSWNPVTTDVNGLTFNEGDITYTLVKYEYREQIIIAEGVTECSYEYQACDPATEQELMQFAVFPISRAGLDGVGLTSEMIPVGASDALPYEESFPGAYMSHTFGMSYDGAEWWLSTEADMQGNVPAQDGDDGFAVMGSDYVDTSARLFTGRIDLSGAYAPELTFHYYALAAEDRNTLQISVDDGSGWTNIGAPFVLGNEANFTWHKATVDLSAYSGKHVQICFEGTIVTHAYIFVDNVKVTDAAHPAPTALSVSAADGNALLTWTAPDTSEYPEAELTGYNVYRNGAKLNATPLTECTYTDNAVPEGSHLYHVTALYATGGESAPCEPVTFNTGGVSAESAADSYVTAADGLIIITAGNEEGYSVCDDSGRVISVGKGNARVHVATGTYIVRLGSTSHKLHVK